MTPLRAWNGQRLAGLRSKRGWSRRETAERLRAELGRMGCPPVGSESSVVKWERNRHSPGADSLAGLCNIFGVGDMAFFFRRGRVAVS